MCVGVVRLTQQVQAIEQSSVLVVDDNPLIVNVITNLLTAENYQVFSASNGQEAFEMLNRKHVDVIICDVMMPQVDGYRFHHMVREQAEHCHIPFVFLTALSDELEIGKGKESGADDYLVKPFDPKNLISVVKGKTLRSRNLRDLSEEKYDSYRKRVIHTLSHEFRTPLVAINTGTELLLEEHGQLDISRMRHLLEAIQRGGKRLERLVNDFMLLQQIEAGIAKRLFEARGQARKISDILTLFLDSNRTMFSEADFTVDLDDCSDGLEVWVYEPQIQDIFCRVADNSIKFRAQERLIEIHCYKQEQTVVIEFRDRGIGFDPKRVQEAVDVFGQIDRDKLEQQGGGLGLAIASRYAAINSCKLEFEKREGGGSIVSVIMPIYKRK